MKVIDWCLFYKCAIKILPKMLMLLLLNIENTHFQNEIMKSSYLHIIVASTIFVSINFRDLAIL